MPLPPEDEGRGETAPPAEPPPPAPEAPPPAPPPASEPPPTNERPGGPNLPRRVPRSTMAPGLRNPAAPPSPAGRGRTPEQIRAMLSSYSSGLERGRRTAGGPPRHNGNGSQGGLGHARPPGDHPDGTEEQP
jgi:hypothetical protein